MKRRRILWLDNDAALILPYKVALESEGFEVSIVRTLAEASAVLLTSPYDLLILDVMVPLTENDVAHGYSFETASDGAATGLAFYVKHRELLRERHTPVLVMTVRVDRSIENEFTLAGLPSDCFVTKTAMRRATMFIAKITSLVPPCDATAADGVPPSGPPAE